MSELPRVACIMMQKDEDYVLKPWLAYHSYLFGPENLFVFDNGSESQAVRETLTSFQQRGVNVDWRRSSRQDYETKDRIFGDLINKLDALGRYDFLIPIDCDEFVALRTERNCSFRREDISSYLSQLIGESRVLRFPYQLANHPLQPDIYHYFDFFKSFFSANSYADMDHGYHLGRSRRGAEFINTRLIQIHVHNKRFDLMRRQMERSWIGTVDLNDVEKLRNYRGPSVHVAPFLQMDARQFYLKLRDAVHFVLPEFRLMLQSLGAPLEMPTETVEPELLVQTDVSLDPVAAADGGTVTVLLPGPAGSEFAAARFDESLYLAANPDVARPGVDPTVHFCRNGYSEKRKLRPQPADGVPASRPAAVPANNDLKQEPAVLRRESRMSYAGLELQTDAAAPHLGGAIKQGDPYTFCPSVWDYVIARFALSSVLDLGSGCGNASLYFHRKGLHVVAVDGLWASVERSFYPSVQHDLTTGPIRTRVDLVHCQEVVEHIEERYIDHVMDSLLTGRIILMTHALPGQGGHYHVNLQPSEYWINHLTRRGCVHLEEDTRRIRALADRDGAKYMAATGLVFANSRRDQL